MRVASLALTIFCLLLLLPVAQTASPAWTLDVGPGYITTAPVVDDDRVYVRASGFWTGEERPEVLAVRHTGEVEWRYSNPNATQHDMTPLLLVPSGEGACGSWIDLLLVGWTDGTFEARERSSGRLVWSVETPVDVWGITGSPALDGDHVVVPLRQGVGRYCLADGSVDFETQTGLGWRNGVSVTDDGFWIGDESGRLWSVGRNGTATHVTSLVGALRHAPVVVGDRFLLHAQTPDASVLLAYNSSSGDLEEVANLGPSPALPLPTDSGGVFADSSGVTSVKCVPQCAVVSSLSGPVNGEMAWTASAVFHAPVNAPGQGWMTVRINEGGTLAVEPPVNTSFDGYGTSAPAAFNGRLYLGNDAGILLALDDELPVDEAAEDGDSVTLPALGLLLAFTGIAILASRGELLWAWRCLSLTFLVLSVAMLPALGASWSERWGSAPETTQADAWDPSWPDAWLGTQVVVFSFPEESLVVGGLVGHGTVLEATQAAADELGLSLRLDETAIGTYLVSINGTSASGWEYTQNGERGTLAVDDAPMKSDEVLVWRLV